MDCPEGVRYVFVSLKDIKHPQAIHGHVGGIVRLLQLQTDIGPILWSGCSADLDHIIYRSTLRNRPSHYLPLEPLLGITEHLPTRKKWDS